MRGGHVCIVYCCLSSAWPNAWNRVVTYGRDRVAFTKPISSSSWAWARLYFLVLLTAGVAIWCSSNQWNGSGSNTSCSFAALPFKISHGISSMLFSFTAGLWETCVVVLESVCWRWWSHRTEDIWVPESSPRIRPSPIRIVCCGLHMNEKLLLYLSFYRFLSLLHWLMLP